MNNTVTTIPVTITTIPDSVLGQMLQAAIQRAEAAEKRAQIAEYQRDRALSYANHCYNAGYIGVARMPWEQYLRA